MKKYSFDNKNVDIFDLTKLFYLDINKKHKDNNQLDFLKIDFLYNEIIKKNLSDVIYDKKKYNIYDLFLMLCEFQERITENSCEGCILNKFCDTNQADKFWNEVYNCTNYKNL